MIKHFLYPIVVLLIATATFAATGDTTIVVAHSGSNLSWNGNYDIWSYIPDQGKTYQKVIMKFTLGAGLPQCSHWDYTVTAELGKKNGAIDTTLVSIDTLTDDTTWAYSDHVNFTEVGRLITPYGNYMDWNWPVNQRHGFDSSWTHPYIYDITDYAGLLKDSVNVRVNYSGWSAAFNAKVEFIFIEGTPDRTVENVREIYHSYYGYANSADFENQVSAKTFSIAPNVTSAKVTVFISGHGNQGEFDPRSFHIKVNGTEVYTKLFWKDDCDVNPVSPQGGTWIFSRANWCPGDKVPVYEADITSYITPGQNVSIDLDLDDFTIQNGAAAGYGISAHLVTYSTQKQNDAMMEEIIAPNNDKRFLHWNPVCTQPKVRIKNMGMQDLTYAEIKYWVKGGTFWYYEWTGNLRPFESQDLTLPAFDWFGLDTTDRVFYAEVKWPNQVPDEYTFNDKAASSFNMTPKLDSLSYILFGANNQPQENWYTVRNEAGDTIDIKTTFTASTIIRDTLRLSPGSYAFDFYDFDNTNWGCGDGLKFFVNQPPNAASTDAWWETTGQLKLYKIPGAVIKTFDPDLGRNVHYEFTVGYPLGFNPPKNAPTEPVHNTGIAEVAATADMHVFPNPANNLINIQIDLSKESDGIIELTDISGRTVRTFHVDNSTHHFLSVPTADLSKGMYFVNFVAQGMNVCKRVIVQ